MLVDVQRTAIPELTRVFGHSGLYLRPLADIAPELSGNMLAQVVSLHRIDKGFSGQVQCGDGELPFASESQSLVYACFVLETSPAPLALLAEFRRVLKPEGVAMVFGLNPWSPCVFRHGRAGAHLHSVGTSDQMARECGFSPMTRQFLGPCRLGGVSRMGVGWGDTLRPAYLLVLRRRDAPLTPLRKPASAASLRPGISLG